MTAHLNSADDSTPRFAAAVRTSAWAVIVLNALVRVVISLDPFPQWSMDPTITTTPRTGLGPTATLALDTAVLLGVGLVWLTQAWGRRGLAVLPVLLTAVGAVGVGVHAFRGGVWLDDLRIGASWAAAFSGGLAMAHLAADARLRRLTVAVGIGVIGMLAAKGALEVFVEHPEMLRRFERDRASILGAHGWTEDSPMARGFRRRLEQPEATGWFGLANLYASFAAASMVTLVGLGAVAWRGTRTARQDVPDGVAALVSLGAIVAGGCVVMAGSKAGYAVAGLGLVLLAIAWLSAGDAGARPRWFGVRGPIVGGPLAFAVVAAVVVAVMLRGAAGEASGERSLLFRWFYMQGAARVILKHPWMGTGPDGFRDAYMLAKTPLSPEAVESPHSIAFDLAARLGVPGLAWVCVFGWLVWRAGTALTSPARAAGTSVESPPGSRRTELWWVMWLTAAPTLLSAWMETPITTIESALARGTGLLAWGAIAWAGLWVMRAAPAWSSAVAAGAVVLAAHAQVEMTPVQPASAPLFFLILACAAPFGSAAPAASARRAATIGAAALYGVAAVALAWFGVLPVARWESRLATGAHQVEALAGIRARLTLISVTAPRGRDSMESIARDLGAAVGQPAPRNDYELDEALRLLTTSSLDRAVGQLALASVAVRHAPTLEALSRLHLARASASTGDAPLVLRHAGEAERCARDGAALGRGRASSLGWLGTVLATRADLEGDPAHLSRAVDAWSEAAACDPHGLTFAVQVFNGLVRLGRLEEARGWARQLLTLHEQSRLDPLMQLTDNQLSEIHGVLAGAGP